MFNSPCHPLVNPFPYQGVVRLQYDSSFDYEGSQPVHLPVVTLNVVGTWTPISIATVVFVLEKKSLRSGFFGGTFPYCKEPATHRVGSIRVVLGVIDRYLVRDQKGLPCLPREGEVGKDSKSTRSL